MSIRLLVSITSSNLDSKFGECDWVGKVADFARGLANSALNKLAMIFCIGIQAMIIGLTRVDS
jgi:hypothetical protein